MKNNYEGFFLLVSFILYVKNILELLKVSKISLNFQNEFKNTLTISFRWKLLIFCIKNNPKVSKVSKEKNTYMNRNR